MGREEEPIVGGALTERGLCSSQRNGINGSEGHSLAFAPGRQGRGWVLGGLRTEWRLSVKKGLHIPGPRKEEEGTLGEAGRARTR